MVSTRLFSLGIILLGVAAAQASISPEAADAQLPCDPATKGFPSSGSSQYVLDTDHFSPAGVVAAAHDSKRTAARRACHTLAKRHPSLRLAFPGSSQYVLDIEHFSASATQNATCTVEPSTPDEVAVLIRVINKTRTPWAVKGHGHSYSQGFSSTPGLLIALSQFNQSTYDPVTNTARVGSGTTWDKVYAALETQGVTVVGARIEGVGTGGATLGGGYSYKTNQFGLSSDNVVAYELVTYAGNILNVTQESHPDLFFGLQGGLNNFGIVTNFVMRAHPQTLINAGVLLVTPENIEAYKQAVVKFAATNKDPKADLNPLFTYFDGALNGIAFLYYDAPLLPHGTFSDFIALGLSIQQQSLSSFIDLFPVPDSDAPIRSVDHTAPISAYPTEMIDFIANETIRQGKFLTTRHSATNVTSTPEIFLPSAFRHSRPAAYPHSVAKFTNPFNADVMYLNASEDAFMAHAVKQYVNNIQAKAIELGLSTPDSVLYPNYAVAHTPLRLLYGDNVDRLRAISRAHDPNNLLSLTGGFKFCYND